MIVPFYRHGIFSNKESMVYLAQKLAETGYFGAANNEDYVWKDEVVKSGLALAEKVLSIAQGESKVLLVGHSQGGLVCRAAAVALAGNSLGTQGCFTERIRRWQCARNVVVPFRGKLGVVTIATPNAGAITFGQGSVTVELLARGIAEAARLSAGFHNLADLTTPRLFQEFEHWRVRAKYLSISGVCVNRYSRGPTRLAELWPVKRVSVRFDLPNDLVVEDSSTDLRQSLVRPEVDLDENYKHVRAYPNSISLNHSSIHDSPEVATVIREHVTWLVS